MNDKCARCNANMVDPVSVFRGLCSKCRHELDHASHENNIPREEHAGMSNAETAVFFKLIAAWNEYVQLPVEHESDHREFQHHLHILQRMVLSRPIRRNFNKIKYS